MAINADFPMLNFEQANPWLTGFNLGQQGMRQSLAFPKDLLAKELANKHQEIMNQISGVQAKYAEPMTQEDLQKAKLMNAYQQQVNQFYGPNIQSEMGLRGAQTNKINTMLPQELLAQKLANRESQTLLDNPLLRGPETKDLAAMRMAGIISPEQEQEIVKGLTQKPLTDVQYKQSLMQSMAAKPFTSLPAAEKSQAIAIGKQFGLTGDQVSRYLNQGKTLPDIAEMTGHSRDPSTWEAANYAPTQSNVTKAKELNASRASMNVFDEFVGKNLAPYIANFHGMSPALVYDSIKDLNPEKRQKALAASILSLEDISERARALNLPLGVTQTREMLEAAYLKSKLPASLIRSNDFVKANEMVMNVLNKASNEANKARLGTGFENRNNQSIRNQKQDLSHMSDDELRRIAG